MIDADIRNAVYQLHRCGRPGREISRQFQISRNTVRQIIAQQGVMPQAARKDRIEIDPDLLRRLYHECDGWMQRVHEKLVEEERIEIRYSTLTRLLRALDLGSSRTGRCDQVPDQPGVEMQHDTSVYQAKLGDQPARVIASMLYLRYSKWRYLKFYRAFNRFAMKCFLHEALMFWGHSAEHCIIDNTNLARLRGTGKRAVIVPEMVSFGKQYGFEFTCHEVGHANRKAGEERGFFTVETNFLPGRIFASLEDMNRQALEWATVRMHHRPIGKTGLIPAKAFEHERSYLTSLPSYLPAPYCAHDRDVDQYGYVPFQSNYYWVPGDRRGQVKLLQYADHVTIYQHRKCLAEYPLPADGIKHARFSPEGHPVPRHLPKNRKNGSQQEENRLRALGPEVAAYVDYIRKAPGIQPHHFVRELWALSLQVTPDVFLQTMERALRYGVTNLQSVQRIAWLYVSQGEQPLPDVMIDEGFRQRRAYQEGCLTDEPDLSLYEPTTPEAPDSTQPPAEEQCK